MPFGLTNRPTIFQKLISFHLDRMEKYVVVYIGNILIFFATNEDHLKNVQNVFNHILKFKLKLAKFEFSMIEINSLGLM